HFECLWDLFRSIPSLEQPDASVLDEFYWLNKEDPNYSKCRAINSGGKRIDTDGDFTLSKKAIKEILSLCMKKEEDLDLIIGVGYKIAGAIEEAAKNYPEKEFAIVDHAYEKQPENVTSLVYEDNTSSYLAGLIAGKMTKTNKVAFISGMESAVLARFQYGYMAGVKAANPDCEVVVRCANSFNDAALGKSIANQMHKDGADVIFTAAGAVGTGAIEAAKENGKMAIGVDTDQNALAPNNVITSAVKNIDVSVIDLIGKLIDGNYKG
ncbi:MAG: oleate hydratase, partial [Intestinibacter bartlettii]|nr:oleate hydratase [Intestinibacter bartlettii]